MNAAQNHISTTSLYMTLLRGNQSSYGQRRVAEWIIQLAGMIANDDYRQYLNTGNIDSGERLSAAQIRLIAGNLGCDPGELIERSYELDRLQKQAKNANPAQDAVDARRYRYLRERSLKSESPVFAAADDSIVNGTDLDHRVDEALAAQDKIQRMMRALARTVGVKRSRGDDAIINDGADGEDAIAINCRDLVKFYEKDDQ